MDQRADRVERVEQEVRIELQAQELELGPGQLRLQLEARTARSRLSRCRTSHWLTAEHLEAEEQVAQVGADEVLPRDLPAPGRMAERAPRIASRAVAGNQ